jgi:hypothetical protein
MQAPALSFTTSNGRYYQHPQDKNYQVPSITNVIGMKDKPALKYWASRQVAEFAADNLDTIRALKRAEIIDLLKGAPFRKTADSSNVGQIVHNWIDEYAKGAGEFEQPEAYEMAPRAAQRMWNQFIGIVRKYELQFIFTETTVWSEKHDYAGTFDWMARMGSNPSVILGDTKTGNGIYPEVGMQLAAVDGADYAINSADGEKFTLPKAEQFGVMHIRPTYARLSPIARIDKCFKAFLGLRAVFDFEVNDADNVIEYAPKIESQEQ